MATALDTVRDYTGHEYKYGFVTEIESDIVPKGLDEDVVRLISAKKGEPAWMTEWRLKALARWRTVEEPTWAKVEHPPIDFQAISYYAAPKSDADRPKSLAEVDPELLRTYERLGIPIREQEVLAGVAVDYVFDSVSVATTFKEKLGELGVIFCSISEALRDHPELVRRYLGSVVPQGDNFYAALNSAVFSDGSFVYVPKGVRCPMELSTYFRINAAETGQFERTLIIADEGAYVSYLEGCTAPQRDENQLHAAVVELIALDDAQIKYSTVQNWYPGDQRGPRRHLQLRDQARRLPRPPLQDLLDPGGDRLGDHLEVSRAASCRATNSVGEFYSVALTNNHQQADTGTKMVHIGKNTRSRIVSKGISAGRSNNTYRGLVRVLKGADNARNHTQCNSMLIGDRCGAHTVPYIEVKNRSARVEHEATTSKISEDQLFYCRQRGLSDEDAVALIVNGFCKEVMQELPMEFAVEAQKLLAISLEGSVG